MSALAVGACGAPAEAPATAREAEDGPTSDLRASAPNDARAAAPDAAAPIDLRIGLDPGDPAADAASPEADAAPRVADAEPLDAVDPDAPPFALAAPPLLGRPSATGIVANVIPTDGGEVLLERLDGAGRAVARGAVMAVTAGEPVVVGLGGLAPDTAYAYRVLGRGPGETAWRIAAAGTFHTQRPPGAPFVFTVQADSHLDDKSDLELYHRALENVRAAAPDFHLDLGDTFMCEKHAAAFTAERRAAPDPATVEARYRAERAHFGLIGPTVPLFLINGNHEGEQGWRRVPGAPDLPEWVTLARKRFYPNPEPDGFYGGPAEPDPEPGLGQRQAYYSFTWGDALFVVLDPFWYTEGSPRDGWSWTLGEAQYRWLATTLDESGARHKFVFAHHLVGGGPSNRGGVEVAHLYEWGGQEPDGRPAFAERRPGWDAPIHDLLVATGVSVFFHGHDHLYAHQTLDGVVYQEVPQPSAINTRNAAMLAEEGGYASGTILPSSGTLKVSVEAASVRVEYVRAFVGPESARNGEVAHAFTVEARR